MIAIPLRFHSLLPSPKPCPHICVLQHRSSFLHENAKIRKCENAKFVVELPWVTEIENMARNYETTKVRYYESTILQNYKTTRLRDYNAAKIAHEEVWV